VARETLGGFELLLLAILLDQPRDAYGVSIMERIVERTGKTSDLGAVYKGLDRLQKKGMVTSAWGEPTQERGGRRKRYYQIEPSGAEAVRRTFQLMQPSGASPVPIGA
jgi:PadR family transcriptional regulator PadR